jgi:hypothetical protein
MSEHAITVESGSSVRLKTAGKYCDRDIVVTATGGDLTVTQEMQNVIDTIITNGTGTAKTIESNVTSLRQYALRGADFVAVNLPNVTTMGTYAFHNCTALVDVHLPKITALGGYDFQNCRKVKVFDFPLLTSIGVASFYGCSGMTALILRSNTMCTLKNTGVFTNASVASGTGFVYVPKELVEDYKAASNWSSFASQIRALEDYTVDGTVTGELDESKI